MKKLTTEEFIVKARKTHSDKYDYSKVKYTNNKVKVCIICPEHGEFWQTPHNHLVGQNCPKCTNNNLKKNTTDFIKQAVEIHNGKYDYSKVEYTSNKDKICIICPEHGEFWQTPKRHLAGDGCPICRANKKLTTEEFVAKAKKTHNDKYDYSRVKYVNTRTKVCII